MKFWQGIDQYGNTKIGKDSTQTRLQAVWPFRPPEWYGNIAILQYCHKILPPPYCIHIAILHSRLRETRLSINGNGVSRQGQHVFCCCQIRALGLWNNCNMIVVSIFHLAHSMAVRKYHTVWYTWIHAWTYMYVRTYTYVHVDVRIHTWTMYHYWSEHTVYLPW